MPPQVEREHAVRRPTIGAGRKELRTLCGAALHLHDMRDGMHGPAVLPVQGDRLAAACLGLLVIAGFFESERIHPFDEAIARHVAIPVRQHAGNSIAQHVRIAEEEVADMRVLKRQQIARIGDRRAAPQFDRPFPIAVEPRTHRGNVHPLAVVGLRRQRFGRLHALDQFRLERLVGRGRQRAGAKGVRHREVRMVGDDLVDLGQRVGLIGMQQVARLIERVDRLLLAIRNRVTPLVELGHGLLPNLRPRRTQRHLLPSDESTPIVRIL